MKIESKSRGDPAARAGCGVRWELVGVAVGLAAIAMAEPRLPTVWMLMLVLAATGLLLFAVGLPQWTSRNLAEAVVKYMQSIWADGRSHEARGLLRDVAESLSQLLARSSNQGEGGRGPRIQSMLRPRRLFVLSEYEDQHRPGVEHAVTMAISAGASDEGALALAQKPRDVADLHALLAQLRRMMIELG